MGWASFAIEKLQQGETVQVRPSGHSMTGRVNHKDVVTLAPCGPADAGHNHDESSPRPRRGSPDDLKVGDVVLVRVRGNVYLHLIKAVDNHQRFLIGNNRGKVNGWVGRSAIYGIAIKVDPGTKR